MFTHGDAPKMSDVKGRAKMATKRNAKKGKKLRKVKKLEAATPMTIDKLKPL
jgi:hypothetical protein